MVQHARSGRCDAVGELRGEASLGTPQALEVREDVDAGRQLRAAEHLLPRQYLDVLAELGSPVLEEPAHRVRVLLADEVVDHTSPVGVSEKWLWIARQHGRDATPRSSRASTIETRPVRRRPGVSPPVARELHADAAQARSPCRSQRSEA